MIDSHTQQRNNATGMLLAGIVIGAIVGAGAVVLSDEKKRKKVLEKMEHVRNKASHIMKHAKGGIREMGSKVQEGARTIENNADDTFDETTRKQRS